MLLRRGLVSQLPRAIYKPVHLLLLLLATVISIASHHAVYEIPLTRSSCTLSSSDPAQQEAAYNRLMELSGTIMDDRWLTITDA